MLVACYSSKQRIGTFWYFTLKRFIGVEKNPQIGFHYPAYVDQKVLKELPHVVAGVDLLHFDLCVHVAMVQEVDIRNFDLRKDTVYTELNIRNKDISIRSHILGLHGLGRRQQLDQWLKKN